ncbi:MAG TPA: sodium/proton-translocating pyrophosphatase [Polyangiaceae bacterium]|nr:sodium/proton-translocating pyrophosphatase [Polyangiaceae bacterium]
MTELGLIVGIDAVGLALALLMWRELSVREAPVPAIRRLGSALERAARAFLWQELRLVAAVTLPLAALAGAGGAVAAAQSPVGNLESAFWLASGLGLGAICATISAYAATILAIRGAVRAAGAAAQSLDGALSVAMRAAGTAALFGETLSVLGLGGLFAVIFAIKGGFALAAEQSAPLAVRVASLLPSFALGAAAAGLVLQRGGGAFHAASGVGSDQAGERDAGLDHDDARNPAVVAELVGDHVGASATRVVDGFVSSSVANSAALIIGAALSAATPHDDPLLLLALPLVVRAFGVIASAFGVFLVRTDEVSNVSFAFLRGYLSTATIALVGLAGATFWLLGERFLPVFAAGTLGILALLGAAHLLALRLGRRSGFMRDANEGLRVGGGAVIAATLGAGFETALAPIAILGFAGLVAARIGSSSSAPGGVTTCLIVFALAALSLAPYVLSIATLGSIADSARGIASMTSADSELRRRSSRLDDAGFLGSAVARQYAIFSGGLASLLLAWAIAVQTHAANAASPSAGESSVLSWCGLLGAAVVLGYAGSVARAAVRGAREVSSEVERQLRGFPREHGVAQVPADYTPSYKTCVELTTAISLRRAVAPILVGLSVPLALGFLLRALYRNLAPALVTLGLTWFVLIAALSGLTAALCLDAARATLGSVRRANRVRDGALGAFSTSITADALSDIFGNAATPALSLLVKATAATALVIAPLLS